MTLIKSISGIRGTIGGAPGEGLSPLDIVKFTYAYCEKMRERRPKAEGERYKVVVGKDARLSGEMVEQTGMRHARRLRCGCGQGGFRLYSYH